MAFKIRRQPPIKGGRMKLGAGVIREIEREVTRRAIKFHVSRSFVIAVALAQAFGVSGQAQYEDD